MKSDDFFCLNHISYDDFLTRSPLQMSISLANGQFVVIIYTGRGDLGHSQVSTRKLLWIVDLIVDGRGEEIKD
jgi:hypothetical protein